MKTKIFTLMIALTAIAVLLVGCANTSNKTKQIIYDFENDTEGFTPIFSDYLADESNIDIYELNSKHDSVTINEQDSKALYIAAHNRSDDIFIGYTKEITELKQNQDYTFNVSFDLITNVDAGGIGIGGSPGAAVYVKAGIVSQSLDIGVDDLNHYRFTNVDKGNQSQEGVDMKVLGNIEKPEENWVEGFMAKSFSITMDVTANENGSVYLILGTDSGFEGFTEYYLDNISISYSKK